MTTAETESERHAGMVAAMSRLRRARVEELSLGRVLLVLGAVCLPAGLVAIIVGWYGVAHTGHLYEQNSYLISGGILGLSLVVIGGFLYFGYWITRQIDATHAASQQTVRALARLEAQLAAIAGSGGAGLASPAVTNGAPAGVRAALVTTVRGSLVHRPDCPVVAGKSRLRRVDPATPGLRPCRICAPFDAEALPSRS